MKAVKQGARRNLIVIRAGEDSTHAGWLRGTEVPNFDLFVSYYGAVPDRYRGDADIYEMRPGLQWPVHDLMCREMGALIGRYDYVCFACDDLEAPVQVWNRLFKACRRHRLDLGQPAIEGVVSYEITRPVAGCVLRYTNFVEIMCPVFSREALGLVRHTFGESVSGWGLSMAWWFHLGKRGRVGILDQIRVRHGRALGGGTLYTELAAVGVEAMDEKLRLAAKYESVGYEPREISRRRTMWGWLGERFGPQAAFSRLTKMIYAMAEQFYLDT